MSQKQRIKRYAGMVAAALCVLAGIASFVSMGQAIGQAVGTAYSAPVMVDD
jgi:hypothetical protein